MLNAIKLTVSFENESLHQVLKEVATKANLQMVVSPRVKDVPVTLDAKEQDVASLLNALGKDRFRWAIEDYGIVRITELAP